MGSVYEAKHVRLPRHYAVKVLLRAVVDTKDAFARFQREAEIASSIGNRHIVEVVDFNCADRRKRQQASRKGQKRPIEPRDPLHSAALRHPFRVRRFLKSVLSRSDWISARV